MLFSFSLGQLRDVLFRVARKAKLRAEAHVVRQARRCACAGGTFLTKVNQRTRLRGFGTAVRATALPCDFGGVLQQIFAVALAQERFKFLHITQVCAQSVTECVAKPLTRGPQRIQLEDELHPVPHSNAQGKDSVTSIQPLNAAHRAQWERHAAASSSVRLARKTQERGRERQAPGVHQVFLALFIGIRQRKDRRDNLSAIPRSIDIGTLIGWQAECLGKLLCLGWGTVVPQRVHDRRHRGDRPRAPGPCTGSACGDGAANQN